MQEGQGRLQVGKALLDTYGYRVLQGGKHDMGLSKEVTSVCLQLPPPGAPLKSTTPKSHEHLTTSPVTSPAPTPTAPEVHLIQQGLQVVPRKARKPLPWELPAHGAALPALSLQLQQHRFALWMLAHN